jgi:Cdc6-like AAA superfamily ATPase
MQEWNVRVKVARGRQVLAGRTEELEAVVALVRQSMGGVAGTLLVTGEAGAGKTALLRESASSMSSSVDERRRTATIQAAAHTY